MSYGVESEGNNQKWSVSSSSHSLAVRNTMLVREGEQEERINGCVHEHVY